MCLIEYVSKCTAQKDNSITKCNTKCLQSKSEIDLVRTQTADTPNIRVAGRQYIAKEAGERKKV